MENNIIHERLVRYYETFMEHTQLGHEEARTRRDYYNGIQHTAEEIAVLKKRKQPVVTDNRIKRKVDYLLGVERQTRTDPKAFPRTPQDDESAQVFTDAIRFVCDNNEWDIERSEGFDYLCVEGIEAYIVDYDSDVDEIKVRSIPWNRFIYDPHSTDRFFRDAKFKGVITWMDQEDAQQMFKGREDFLNISESQENNVFDDKPNNTIWADKERKRVLTVQMYFKHEGVWTHAIFTKEGFLVDPEPSSFLDEHGRPMCNIEAAGAFIDHDNDRYGLVRQMISPQDEINKRKSKYLDLLSRRQTFGNKKAIANVNTAKKELSKADGHIEIQGNAQWGVDFGTIQTSDMAIGQFNLLQDSLSSIESMGQGDVVDSSASGRSKEISQNSNLIELGPLFDAHRQVSKLVYKQIYYRIKQFKTGEWFVRVTDDENNMKFSVLNQPVSGADMVIEKMGREQGEQLINQNPYDPRLAQTFIKNNVTKVNLDIIIEDAPDIVNIQAEQFELLANMYQANPNAIPIDMVIEASSLRNKDRILEHLKGGDPEAQEAMQRQQQEEKQLQDIMLEIELNDKVASTKEKEAKARKIELEAEAIEIENELVTESVNMQFG